jgi:carboxymethylenebutenolidase
LAKLEVDMSAEIEELLQKYRDGEVTRRDFLQKAAVLTGSMAIATSLVDTIGFPTSAAGADKVDSNDPALVSEMVEFPGPAGNLFGYQSRPKVTDNHPAVIVVHAQGGLTDPIKNVARWVAKEGYVALAPDMLSRNGGTAKVAGPTGAVENIRELVTEEVIRGDIDATAKYLRALKGIRVGRVGITGFCWGGGTAFMAATQVQGLNAVVLFYGNTPKPLELLQRIEAPVMAHYGELDERITSGVPETAAAMKKYGKVFDYKIFAGARHSFGHDPGSRSYHPEAAKEAWSRTFEFFSRHLKN